MKTPSTQFVVQFLRFGLVGLSNTAVAYAVYSALVLLGIHFLIANACSFFVGVLNAYFWSNRYVFKQGKHEYRNPLMTLLKTFAAYAGTGLLLSSFLLYVIINHWGINSLIAQLLCLCITVPLNFILNKYWSFKTQHENS